MSRGTSTLLGGAGSGSAGMTIGGGRLLATMAPPGEFAPAAEPTPPTGGATPAIVALLLAFAPSTDGARAATIALGAATDLPGSAGPTAATVSGAALAVSGAALAVSETALAVSEATLAVSAAAFAVSCAILGSLGLAHLFLDRRNFLRMRRLEVLHHDIMLVAN